MIQLKKTENPCLIVDIIANTNGPNADIVLKIYNWPAAEHNDNRIQSAMNEGYFIIKLILLAKPPCCIKETAVNMQENKFTAHIIWIGLMLNFLNKAPCQLDVKLSNPT